MNFRVLGFGEFQGVCTSIFRGVACAPCSATGLVLSFLTLFNGTVDCFNLQQVRAGVGFLRVS